MSEDIADYGNNPKIIINYIEQFQMLDLFRKFEEKFDLTRLTEDSDFYAASHNGIKVEFDPYEKKVTYFDKKNNLSVRILREMVRFEMNLNYLDDYRRVLDKTELGKSILYWLNFDNGKRLVSEIDDMDDLNDFLEKNKNPEAAYIQNLSLSKNKMHSVSLEESKLKQAEELVLSLYEERKKRIN